MAVLDPATSRQRYDDFYRRSLDDPEGFWLEAAEAIDWSVPPARAFEQPSPPSFTLVPRRPDEPRRSTRSTATCRPGRGDRTALIALDERGGRPPSAPTPSCWREVEACAAALRGLGHRARRPRHHLHADLRRGDRRDARRRSGSARSTRSSSPGFGARRARRPDPPRRGSRAVLTADVTYRKGKDVDAQVDRRRGARRRPERRRARRRPAARAIGDRLQRRPRHLDWDGVPRRRQRAVDGTHEAMEANEPAFILATSGTTAKPKLAVHTHGGYQVHIHAMGRWCFGLDAGRHLVVDLRHRLDRRPQLHRLRAAARRLRRPSPTRARSTIPSPETFWRIDRASIGVTGIFTSPTAVRLLMRYGEERARGVRPVVASSGSSAPARCSTRRPGSGCRRRSSTTASRSSTTCGRPRPAARSSATRTASACCPIKPGLGGHAAAGHRGRRRRRRRASRWPAARRASCAITRPVPGPDRRRSGASPSATARTTGSGSRACTSTGDAAHIDEDGYVWFAGRADEIIKIAGHRIGTIEVETALPAPPGRRRGGRDRLARRAARRGHRGVRRAQGRARRRPTSCAGELLATVRDELGAGGRHRRAQLRATCCPRRAAARSCAASSRPSSLDRDPGDISTIEDEGSVEEARAAVAELRAGLHST